MIKPDTEALRGLLLIAGLLSAAYLMAITWGLMLEQRQRAEVAILRSDLAAYEVRGLIQEARDITEQAARDRGQLP
jgi:hypothetical protein